MEIVVTHLTRMQGGYFCVAGVDPSSGRHIRPVIPGQRLKVALLAANGGPFDIGNVVELGKGRAVGKAPEIEDMEFDMGKARVVRTLNDQDLWALLKTCSVSQLEVVFGPEVQCTPKGKAKVPCNMGQGSLGIVGPVSHLHLHVDQYQKIRALFKLGTNEIDGSLTDIRFFCDDHITPIAEFVEKANTKLQEGVEVLLSVGLSRPFAPLGTDEEAHWFQVNNVHFSNRPVWQHRSTHRRISAHDVKAH
ncbi:MAG: hypothetical protein KA072_14915 [Thermoanaerobaculaceae bacterium]|nr:hypothetical protein [Thermoanaerobaculaceae bacterium]NLH10211.1 hypothetical protein [Holophagae bacterium]